MEGLKPSQEKDRWMEWETKVERWRERQKGVEEMTRGMIEEWQVLSRMVEGVEGRIICEGQKKKRKRDMKDGVMGRSKTAYRQIDNRGGSYASNGWMRRRTMREWCRDESVFRRLIEEDGGKVMEKKMKNWTKECWMEERWMEWIGEMEGCLQAPNKV